MLSECYFVSGPTCCRYLCRDTCRPDARIMRSVSTQLLKSTCHQQTEALDACNCPPIAWHASKHNHKRATACAASPVPFNRRNQTTLVRLTAVLFFSFFSFFFFLGGGGVGFTCSASSRPQVSAMCEFPNPAAGQRPRRNSDRLAAPRNEREDYLGSLLLLFFTALS